MSEEKKIIIDEDWKSQVEAEKAAAAQPSDSEPPASAGGGGNAATPPADADGSQDGQSPSAGGADQDPPMPPASFGMLVSSLATEAIMAMGQVPHPATGETTVRRNQAQYLIDTLDVLKQKTAGNLTPEEAGALDDVLHQLRMAFIAAG